MNSHVMELVRKVLDDPEDSISFDEACELAEDDENTLDLIFGADKIREAFKKTRSSRVP